MFSLRGLCAFAPLREMVSIIQAAVLAKAQRRRHLILEEHPSVRLQFTRRTDFSLSHHRTRRCTEGRALLRARCYIFTLKFALPTEAPMSLARPSRVHPTGASLTNNPVVTAKIDPRWR